MTPRVDDRPPPDPNKVLGQVLVDVGCMLVSVAAAAVVWTVVEEMRGGARIRVPFVPFLPLERLLPLVPAVLVIALGVRLRLQVRELFGVADTAREEPVARPESLARPAVRQPLPIACSRCAGVIPEGRSACPSCGWSEV